MHKRFAFFLLILTLLLLACRAVFPESPTPVGVLPTLESPTPVGGLPAPTTTPSGDGDSAPVTTPSGDGDSAPATTPSGDGDSTQAATTPSGDGDSAPATTPSGDGDSAASVQPLYAVRFHPDGGLFAGDQVSIEVIAAEGVQPGEQVAVQLQGSEQAFGPARFSTFGIGSRTQATLYWAWDTTALPAGDYTLSFSVAPDGPAWTETVSLLPAGEKPLPESRWASAETDCCLVYYFTGTEVERDLDDVLAAIDAQASSAGQALQFNTEEAIPITMLSRVLGHGGFTAGEISVSYLDRNYAGGSPEMVLHHEMIHWLDGQMGGELRPTMLVEGLAVYLTGGHFKPEPLRPRAAALLAPAAGCTPWSVNANSAANSAATSAANGADAADGQVSAAAGQVAATAAPSAQPGCGLDRYLPLGELANRFYFAQHEIGYLQAGALVGYMVETWGWTAFNAFYRDIRPAESGLQADAIEVALRAHFQLSLAELEDGFLEYLRLAQPSPAQVEDLRLTVAYYDTVRRYQQALDPSAYFLHAWLPDANQMRERGIVADFLRHPTAPENIAIETLLVGAFAALKDGDLARAGALLDASDAALDAVEQ